MADTSPDAVTIQDNASAQRYEAHAEGHVAVLVYEREDDQIIFQHTSVPAALEGRGIGAKLAHAALEDARARGLLVIPNCPFVASYIRRHPEYLTLVVEERRQEWEHGR